MANYKFEMHFHTSETSPCGEVTAKDGIALFKNSGYDGVVVTDHMTRGICGTPETTTWEEACEVFLKGYRLAKEYGDAHNFTVLLGAEIMFPNICNHYLVYGLTEKILKDNPWIYLESLQHLYEVAEKNNLLVVQAHPFRERCYLGEEKYLHGIEIFNGNPDHDSRNALAEKACELYNLIPTKGSDFHEVKGLSNNPYILNELPKTEEDLVSLMRKLPKL